MRRTSEGKEMREEKMGGNAEERGEGGGWGREAEKLGMRIKEVERWREEQRREKRRRNIVIKGMEVIGRDLKEEVRKVMKRIERGIELEEVRREEGRGGGGDGGGKGESIEQKARVMKGKGKLAGHKERLEDDLTWEERRIQWKIGRELQRAKWQGRRVRIGYRKAWVDGKLWIWDEEKDRLKDESGNQWEEGREERGR